VSSLQVDVGQTGDAPHDELLFDWNLDVERLEREARKALQDKQPNARGAQGTAGQTAE